MPATSPKPTVVIHTNEQQMIAALVAAHSLKSRSRSPHLFDVRFLRLEDTPHLCKRQNQTYLWEVDSVRWVWNRRDLLAFAPIRRKVPALMGFQGRALVIDPDIFAVGDVYELLSRDMEGKAVFCRLKPAAPGGERRYSSAVMLLDCSKLTNWQWERDINEIFSGRLKMGPWLSLLDEASERIGLFGEEWNHLDTLNEKTKLLHMTEVNTQPWKTGLPADYHQHAQRDPVWIEKLKRIARMGSAGKEPPVRFQPHPDPRQEKLFFTLLKECLELGSITPRMLHKAMRKNYIRKDTFAVLNSVSRS